MLLPFQYDSLIDLSWKKYHSTLVKYIYKIKSFVSAFQEHITTQVFDNNFQNLLKNSQGKVFLSFRDKTKFKGFQAKK